MSYPSRDRDFDGYWNDTGHDAAVEGAHEVEGIVVGVHEGDPVAGLDVDLGRLEPDSVQKCVGDFMRSAQQFA